MSPSQRCDEILRLIEDTLQEVGITDESETLTAEHLGTPRPLTAVTADSQ